jgi:DNA polymerase-3 subunit delta'
MLFKDVMVDEALKQRLIGMVKESRISHALLFLAHEGAAGFALAVAFAQYISCQNRSEHDSCGVCPSCVKYGKLSHPDLHLLFPNSTSPLIKKDPDSEQFYTVFRDFVLKNHYFITLADWLETIEGENKQPSINLRDTSNIINWNSTRSYEGGYKVYILWMAERLYHAAAPRLLKTLEEPENKSLFILISESADHILPTILSRTQMVKIAKPDAGLIADKLIALFGISPAEAQELSLSCDGNINSVIKLLQNGENANVMLPHFQKYWQSICCFAQNRQKQDVDFQGACLVIEEIVKRGREYQKGFVRYLLRMVRLMLLEHSGNMGLIKVSSSERLVLSAFTGILNVANVTSVVQECNKALFHIERNGNSTLILTDLYFKIAGCLTGRRN